MNRGVAAAVAAYFTWGLSPIFWRLVDDVSPGDVVVFRVLATALLLGSIQAVRHNGPQLRVIIADAKTRRLLMLTAVLLSSNWLVFVWAVTSDRVVEASLGYFINPLVSVVLGVVVLGERLGAARWAAVAIAASGVLIVSVDAGRPPWVPLLLASTFGVYGLIRKTAAVESLDGLTLEMVVLLPVALVALVVRAAMGDGTVGTSVPARDLWILGSGLMTATPLLLFTYAARRISLSLLGILQYMAPSMQFLLGVLAYGEDWSGGQVVGYAVVWLGIVVFATPGLREIRARRSTAKRSDTRGQTPV